MTIQDASFIRHFHSFRQRLELEYTDLEKYLNNSLHSLEVSSIKREHPRDDPHAADTDNPLWDFHAGPFIIKHSYFIAVYSFMEYSLRKFCELVAAQTNLYPRRVAEFEKVYQFYFYLLNDVKLDKSCADKEWEQLAIFKDLRNSIIHYNSTIGKSISSESYDFIKEDPRIEFYEPRGFFIRDNSLIFELLETSRTFMFKLMNAYQKSYFENA